MGLPTGQRGRLLWRCNSHGVVIQGFAMKASDLDKEPPPPVMPTAREWLRVAGAAVAIIAICVLWTFWA
jgi:hypothetical protein